jgi:indolepyruvate ferredoxin oxidoreductase, beta subunit
MEKLIKRPYGVIVAGVGGQGTITMAQLILGAAWKSGYFVHQAEVHGMSQRGGSVNAHVLFDTKEVSSPVVMEGSGDLLIGLEPLETLRYLYLLGKNACLISSVVPIKNMTEYPDIDKVLSEFKTVSNVTLVEIDKHSKTLNNRKAGNMILLGIASKHLPVRNDIWEMVIFERFEQKGKDVVHKNIEAFEFGRELA